MKFHQPQAGYHGKPKLELASAGTDDRPTLTDVVNALKQHVHELGLDVPEQPVIFARVSHVQYGWKRMWDVDIHLTKKGAKNGNIAEFKGNKSARVIPINTKDLETNV